MQCLDTVAMTGQLLAIARRERRRAPMESIVGGTISVEAGLAGDCKGAKYPRRQITILAWADWQAALAALTTGGVSPDLPRPDLPRPDLPWPDLPWPDLPWPHLPWPHLSWTVRRANLLIDGIRLPRGKGSLVRVGAALLEVTAETNPCARMDEAHPGLRRALAPEWRGGVTCRVVEAGAIAVGDPVGVVFVVPPRVVRLPG